MPYRGDGLKITAIPSFHDERYGRKRGGNLIHVVEADGEVVCHLGDLGERWNDARIRLLRDLDVLLIPVGGTYTLDAVGAADLVRQAAAEARDSHALSDGVLYVGDRARRPISSNCLMTFASPTTRKRKSVRFLILLPY